MWLHSERLQDEISIRADLPSSQAYCFVTGQMRQTEIWEERDRDAEAEPKRREGRIQTSGDRDSWDSWPLGLIKLPLLALIEQEEE